MAQGQYDHPSYLTRQQIYLGRTTAGAAGTSVFFASPSAIRIRAFNANIFTAGTVVGTGVGAAGVAVALYNGTAIVGGTISLSTNAKGVTGTSGDLNYTLPAGGTLSVVNGTDATFVADVRMEAYIDPAGSWTGSGN